MASSVGGSTCGSSVPAASRMRSSMAIESMRQQPFRGPLPSASEPRWRTARRSSVAQHGGRDVTGAALDQERSQRPRLSRLRHRQLDERRAIQVEGAQSVRPSATRSEGGAAPGGRRTGRSSSRSPWPRRSSPSRSSRARPLGMARSRTATGRPRSVTSTVSPPATRRRMALAFFLCFAVPIRSMCDMVAHVATKPPEGRYRARQALFAACTVSCVVWLARQDFSNLGTS